MVFAGEASWRWKMMVPSTDRSYEFFWRQSARWLSSAAPDPVAIGVPDRAGAGRRHRDRRRRARRVVRAGARRHRRRDADAAGRRHAADQAAPRRSPPAAATRAALGPEQPGLYRIHAEARRGATDARRGRSLDVCRRRGSRVRRPAAERRFPAPRGARFGRPLRRAPPRRRRCRRGCRRRAAERRPRTPRPLARAVGVRARRSRCSRLEWILRRRWGLR